jgi:hypothetical protein
MAFGCHIEGVVVDTASNHAGRDSERWPGNERGNRRGGTPNYSQTHDVLDGVERRTLHVSVAVPGEDEQH